VEIAGRQVAGQGVAEQRLGMVFQDYAVSFDGG